MEEEIDEREKLSYKEIKNFNEKELKKNNESDDEIESRNSRNFRSSVNSNEM